MASSWWSAGEMADEDEPLDVEVPDTIESKVVKSKDLVSSDWK